MLELSTSSTNVMHVVNESVTAADKGLLAHESQHTLEIDIAETDALNSAMKLKCCLRLVRLATTQS